MATFSTSADLNGKTTVIKVLDDGQVTSVELDDPEYLATLPAPSSNGGEK